MTRTSLLLAAAVAALSASPAIARPMTATDMHMMHRLGAPAVSADGRYALFTVSRTDLAANRRSNPLYLLDLRAPGAAPKPVAGADGANSAVFGPDGAIYFLKSVKDRTQLFRMPVGATATQISDFGGEISGFKIAPSGDRVIVWADRPDCPDLACAATTFAAKPEGSGRTYDELFVRHWDSWETPGERSRIYAYPLAGGRLTGGGVRLTGELVGDVPAKPFGGGEEIAFAPDGRTVYFALREAGRIEATSTNLDIFSSPADGSVPPANLTAANDATDTLPSVSPDGRTLAYVAMARPTYEADRQVVMLRDLASGQARPLTQSWDASVGSIAWTRDGRGLIVGVQEVLEHPLYRVDVATGRPTRLTREGNAGNAVPLADGSVLYTMNSVMAPDDLYRGRRRRPGRAANRRQPGTTRPARSGELRKVQLHRRQQRPRLGNEGQASPGGRQAADRLRYPRRAAGQLRQQLVVPLEPAPVRFARLRRRQHRFPRVDRIRPGLHRFDPQQLGRLAARGPAEGSRFRNRERPAARCE